MSEPPLVTVLVPARNEAADLGACLERVLAQDHPADRLEVVVVDGDSTDDTAAVARRALEGAGLWDAAVLGNPVGTTPSNLNVGLAHAHGDVLCRVDARTHLQPDYVRTCVEVLGARPEVAVVGGSQMAIPRDDTARARGIARSLNNRWAMGGSRYRRGAASGPSDTVYLGAFRTAELRAAGGWDERFETNQDYELNRRLGRDGVVWFDARLASGYVPRRTQSALWHQYVRFGRWKVAYWRTTGDRPQVRQLAMLAAPAVGAGALLAAAPRRWPLLAAAGLVAVDQLGSDRAPASVPERAHSLLGLVAVTGGWTVGAWSGLLGRR